MNPVWTQGNEYVYQKTKQVMFVNAGDFMTEFYNTNDSNFNLEFTVYLSSEDKKSIGVAPYEEVSGVELKGISFPKLADMMYFVVDIPEFSGRVHSTNRGAHDKFAVVYYKSSNMNSGDVEPCKGSDFDKKELTFAPPLRNFNKFTVRFLKPDGSKIKYNDFSHIVSLNDTNPDTNPDSKVREMINNISLILEFDIKA